METNTYIFLSGHEGFEGEGDERKPKTFKRGDKVELTEEQAKALVNKVRLEGEDLIDASNSEELESLKERLRVAEEEKANLELKLEELGQ